VMIPELMTSMEDREKKQKAKMERLEKLKTMHFVPVQEDSLDGFFMSDMSFSGEDDCSQSFHDLTKPSHAIALSQRSNYDVLTSRDSSFDEIGIHHVHTIYLGNDVDSSFQRYDTRVQRDRFEIEHVMSDLSIDCR